MNTSDEQTLALADRHFDLLNETCSQKYFVPDHSRHAFIDLYVTFIGERGADYFEKIALRIGAQTDGRATNPCLIGYLRKVLATPVGTAEFAQSENTSRMTLFKQLRSLPWIGGDAAGIRLLAKAGRCNSHDWVLAKSRHVDRLALSDFEKTDLFEHELDKALAEQQDPASTGSR